MNCTPTSTSRCCSSCPGASTPCATARRPPPSRAICAPTRSSEPTCRCRSCGTTPRISASGSRRCDRTPTTSTTSSANGSSRREDHAGHRQRVEGSRRSPLRGGRANGRRELARPGPDHHVRWGRRDRLHRLPAPGSDDDDRPRRARVGRAPDRHERAGGRGGLGPTGAAGELEARRVLAVREAVGPDVRIMVDAVESWSLARARRTGRVLQDAGIAWLEEPVHHLDVAGLAELRRQLEVPIAAGEHLYHLDAFRMLLEARAVDVVILDLARVGGVTPWRKIAAMAHAHRIAVCGHVVPEIQVHLLSAIPNGHLVEYVPRSAGIPPAMPRLAKGELVAPPGPGPRLQLDEPAIPRYQVD